MNHIIDNIINGNRIDAIVMLNSSPYSFDDLIEYLIELNMIDEIALMFRVAIRINYIGYKRIKNV